MGFLSSVTCIFSLLFQQALNITELATYCLVCVQQVNELSAVALRQAARKYAPPYSYLIQTGVPKVP